LAPSAITLRPAIVTALSNNYCFQNKMAAEYPLANKSPKKKLKKLKHILFP
jgi:hypothetical protein